MGVAVDLTEQRFGNLTAKEVVIENGARKWSCMCDCGKVVCVRAGALRFGNNVSCGCIKESVEIKCDICQKPVRRKKSRVGRYCSHKCYWIGRQGRPAWNKGLPGPPSKRKGIKLGPMSQTNRDAIAAGWRKRKGQKRNRHYPSGENHPMWMGGITSESDKQRIKFRRTVQKEVFARDNYACVKCGEKGFLHVNHLKSWSDHPELRFDLVNCQTVCRACHYYITYNRQMPEGSLWGIGKIDKKAG